MIQKHDEFLHEFTKSRDWRESFTLNIIDKKNKVFGFADIDYIFNKKKAEFNWLLIVNDKKYNYNNIVDIEGNPGKDIINDNKKHEYKIITPLKNFQVKLNNENIKSQITISGIYPIYAFTSNLADNHPSQKSQKKIQLWEQYEQRCKITGNIKIKKGEDKGLSKTLNCFGQREHSWGSRLQNKINCHSRLSIQFRDMGMVLFYVDIDGSPISRGFISKKRSNIPIQSVEFESISFNKDKNISTSAEFSYKDAMDDVDLVVSKTIHSIPLPLPNNQRKKFIRIINFSEFTIIGTNKKGVGMEDHLISIEKLHSMD